MIFTTGRFKEKSRFSPLLLTMIKNGFLCAHFAPRAEFSGHAVINGSLPKKQQLFDYARELEQGTLKFAISWEF
jgi:hypothetical protein